MGRQAALKRVALGSDNQSQDIILNTVAAKGIYLVKVSDQDHKAVFSKKIIVQ